MTSTFLDIWVLINITRHFYWSKMSKNVKRYILSCNTCQRNKGNNQQPAGLLQPLETRQQHWKQIAMNFIVQFSLTRQDNDAIVIFTDCLIIRGHFQAMHTIHVVEIVLLLTQFQKSS